jgi:putative transposase
MSNYNDIRQGRHCVIPMHVYLVFVTKYRREVFTKEILDDLRGIFASVCAGFEAELVEFDGEDDHVHLSPSYFVGNCGGAPIEIIRQYIEQQQTPH